MNQILPLLSKYVPAALALKGISKVNPRLSTAIQAATGAGYGADAIIDYLRNSMEPAGITQKRQQLAQGASEGTLRPDEISNQRNLEQKNGSSSLPIAAAGLGGIAGLMGGQGEEQPEQEQAVSPQEIQSNIDYGKQQVTAMQQKLNQLGNSPSLQNATNLARSGIKDIIGKQEKVAPQGSIKELLQMKTSQQSRMQPEPQKKKENVDDAILKALENLLNL